MNTEIMAGFVRVVTGLRLAEELEPQGSSPTPTVYYANHSSHLDFLAIWSCLPKCVRLHTSPVAAVDYWGKTKVRRWVAQRVFQAVLIDRQKVTLRNNPIMLLGEKLKAGCSLIIFPEGTRSLDGTLKVFQVGIYHLAKRNPEIPFTPVWLENLNRILPKGYHLPVPIMGRIVFGEAIYIRQDESKTSFLQRARQELTSLSQ